MNRTQRNVKSAPGVGVSLALMGLGCLAIGFAPVGTLNGAHLLGMALTSAGLVIFGGSV